MLLLYAWNTKRKYTSISERINQRVICNIPILQIIQSIYQVIFSYSGGYNYNNAQICLEFKSTLPRVSLAAYLDQLLAEGKDIEFAPSLGMFEVAYQEELLNLLNYNRVYIPEDICGRSSRDGKLKVLQWARRENYLWDDQVCRNAAEGGHLEILKWLYCVGWFHEREILCKSNAFA
ncbi:Ankyrin repeat-containing protein [Brazilian cedratvirus IHUMI]|uniref:Ankyrin repeat-containing protein n=1 Tax=Brazilian cedratvirus IHUMI TaxID=2126980 RepID=A0A2R8FFX2_9VIRU|nr:Ankyrin repeat-containing protein [Brazilian cedratvirus IHUMI]